MIFFRPRSQTRRLIEMLAVTGEFPVSSLYLFGSQRTMRELVRRMTEIQQYRNTETGETVTCRLLTLSGRGRNKAVRLLKTALPILDSVGAREYYEAAWREHNLPSDASHREPRFRCAEASVMLILAGVEIRPSGSRRCKPVWAVRCCRNGRAFILPASSKTCGTERSRRSSTSECQAWFCPGMGAWPCIIPGMLS